MGSLPPSTDIVLDIHLNKLIRDFLFSEVGDGSLNPLWNESTEGKVEQCAWEGEVGTGNAVPWITDSLFAKNSKISSAADSEPKATAAYGGPQTVASAKDDQTSVLQLSYTPDGCGIKTASMISENHPSAAPEIVLKVHEQTSNLRIPPKTVKVFCLTKSQSVMGSLFCFSMQNQAEKTETGGTHRAGGNSVKLTRVGSVPCHSNLLGENDKRCKFTRQKPPRPPRSSSEKTSDPRHAAGDAVLLMHGTYSRARPERRKNRGSFLSYNASTWALILTLFFAFAMLGEGFWSQNSAFAGIHSSRSLSIFGNTANVNTQVSSRMLLEEKTREIVGPYISSQPKKDMQEHEFGMLRGGNPALMHRQI